MILPKNSIQRTITNSLACDKKNNAYYSITGANKQKVHTFFGESTITLQLLAASADVEAKIHLKKPGILSPDCLRVFFPHRSQEKRSEKLLVLKMYLTIAPFAAEGKRPQIKKVDYSFNYNHFTKPDHFQIVEFCSTLCFIRNN